MVIKALCRKCKALAVWCYMPGDSDVYYCDSCVPRGCSCDESTDEKGRPYPCVEYDYNEKGFVIQL